MEVLTPIFVSQFQKELRNRGAALLFKIFQILFPAASSRTNVNEEKRICKYMVRVAQGGAANSFSSAPVELGGADLGTVLQNNCVKKHFFVISATRIVKVQRRLLGKPVKRVFLHEPASILIVFQFSGPGLHASRDSKARCNQRESAPASTD